LNNHCLVAAPSDCKRMSCFGDIDTIDGFLIWLVVLLEFLIQGFQASTMALLKFNAA